MQIVFNSNFYLISVLIFLSLQTYDEWKEMLPDFSEYNWVIPDFVWELSDQIDLGKCSRGLVTVVNSLSLSYCI